MSPHRRDDDDEDDFELARTTREVREGDVRKFDPSRWLFPGGFVVTIVGAVWGMSAGFSNYNHRFDDQQREITQQEVEIKKLRRQVVYTFEWRAWREVFQITNAGKIVVPDPKDYTSDRTE